MDGWIDDFDDLVGIFLVGSDLTCLEVLVFLNTFQMTRSPSSSVLVFK